MSKKTGRLSFYGKPVIDLKTRLRFRVSDAHSAEGERKNGELCPGALGLKDNCVLKGKKCSRAEVHRAVVYLDFGDKNAYRARMSSPLRREVISQDKGGKFDPGEYELVPVPPSEHKRRNRAHGKEPNGYKRPNKFKRKTPKLIIGIRKLALSSKNVSSG